MIHLVLKRRDEMMIMMMVMSAGVQGIPLSLSLCWQDKESQACQQARRRRCEEAGLRLAATGFLLVTSPKMETGSLRAGLDRFGFHIEANFKMPPVWHHNGDWCTFFNQSNTVSSSKFCFILKWTVSVCFDPGPQTEQSVQGRSVLLRGASTGLYICWSGVL